MAHNTSGTGSVVITESNVINRKNNYARQTSQTTLKLRNPTPENQEPPKKEYKWDIRWRNVFFFIYLHYALTRGLYILFTFGSKPQTFLWTCFLILASGLGITAGAHRLWAHKTFKAKTPLRIILATLNLIAFENHIYEWVRDHRVHHKFTDTDADPHNSKRGFFFSHMGWLMVRKQEEVKTKGKVIDMSDLEQDWVVMFQKKYYAILMPLFCLVIPTVVPIYFWNEDPWVSWYLPTLTRYCLVLHGTWSVNSAAHMWGTKPYDKRISPVENVYVAIFAYGEGWHNYHHAFPWDYKTSELSAYSSNYTKAFIDFFARIGWAYDLKTVKPELIAARAKRIGDGSHQDTSSPSDTSLDDIHQVDGSNVWGWEDRDLSEKDKSLLDIVNLKKITT